MEVLYEQLEVCDTRGSRWKYIGVQGSSLMETSTEYGRGSCS